MWDKVTKFFGFSGVADTALKIVDKIAGTDWTPDQKAKFTLDYLEATKHQSPARRMIATGIMLEHVMLVSVWTYSTLAGDKVTADSIMAFMKSSINITLDIVVGFYFLLGMTKK